MIDPTFIFTVTVYHKVTDKSTGRTVTSWKRSVYKNCFFGVVSAERLTDTTLSPADSFVARIPYNNSIEISPGDIIVSGNIDAVIEDVSGKRSSDLLERYKGKAFAASSVSVNSVLPYAKHIRVSGV